IGDVARRHGQTRIGSAGCYLRSDDEASLQAVLTDRALAPLQLRRIAPTVLVSPAHATTVLEMLREHSHSPIAESSSGAAVGAGSAKDRAPTPRPAPPVAVSLVDESLAERLVTAMRAGERDRPEPSAGPRIPSTEPSVTRSLLQEAVSTNVRVWIGYAEPSGELRRALFRPRQIEGGRVSGLVSPGENDPEHPRTFSIHRITGIAEAT
ncbi:MAG: helicase-associated domain-containing protein, partial [Allobranchiibius sp.]